MLVREKTPDKILVKTDTLKMEISEDKNQKELKAEYANSKDIFEFAGGGFFTCLLTLFSSWNELKREMIIVISLIGIVFMGYTFWNLIKMLQSGKKLKVMESKNLMEDIINKVKSEILYTALLLICYQDENGKVKFSTEKYGNFLIHCEMEPGNEVIEQKESIINYLAATYDVQKSHIRDILPLSEAPFFSIKPVHGETQQNGFILFQVKLKKNAKQQLLNRQDISWKSIQEMGELPDLMGRNQDIVMALNENKIRIEDSFEDNHGTLHIIWNITKECPYHCTICATCDESRKELSMENKLQVLNHINSVKERIRILDFAGGDPLYKSDIRTIIMQAINALGEEHISVTTTGKGIQEIDNIPEEDISKLLRNCEITIDASHENLSPSSLKSNFSRNSSDYCQYNYEQIENVSENIYHLTINIPLLDDDLDDNEIENLISKLYRLRERYPNIQIEAQIIRLMPVGAFSEKYTDIEKYRNYHPLEIAKKISRRINEFGILCDYHCSLRVLPELGVCEKRCHMLERKIGIDCAGNVFACTWGAYLKMPDQQGIDKNPFYLGNLVSSDLKSILDGQGCKTVAYKRISKDISKKSAKPYCEAVSWFFQKSLENNSDPLSK